MHLSSLLLGGVQCRKVGGDDSRKILQDAQGNKIPTQGKREVEITLKDSLGRSVVFRERVTISDAVSQPILCFGKMMEQGWSIDGREQMMVHRDALEEIKVPVEMQNRSVTVMGHIRVVQQTPTPISQDDDCQVGRFSEEPEPRLDHQ